MKTYYLPTEQIDAYLLDLLDRVKRLDPLPAVWCPVTRSGDELVKKLTNFAAKHEPSILEKAELLSIEIDNGGREISFLGGDPSEALAGKSVLLLDGAVHSGNTMCRCVDRILSHKPSHLTSYSIVVKRSSAFLPTFWSLMIDHTDRAYFLLDRIPNNRLNTGKSRKQPFVHLRKLDSAVSHRPLLESGVPSIDRLTWTDRYFQMQVSNSCTYVLETAAAIVGFVSVHIADQELVVDEVVVDPNARAHGYGGILMRFADTLARHHDCRFVRLNAIENKVDWYRGFGYEPIPGHAAISLDDEKYHPMHRKVLYHHNPLED